MPDHLCGNTITGGVQYWLVRRYTSRDVNIQSHFEESSTLFLKIIADNTKWPAPQTPRLCMTSHAPANLCNRSVSLFTFTVRFAWFIAPVRD